MVVVVGVRGVGLLGVVSRGRRGSGGCRRRRMDVSCEDIDRHHFLDQKGCFRVV